LHEVLTGAGHADVRRFFLQGNRALLPGRAARCAECRGDQQAGASPAASSV